MKTLADWYPGDADTLLTVARICYPNPGLKGHLTMIPRHHNLEQRVAELLDEGRDRSTHLARRQRTILLASLVLTLGAISSVGLHGAANAKDKSSSIVADLQTTPKGPAEAARVKPPSGEKVTGVVHAADGSTAAGATVWAAMLYQDVLVRQETVTDEQGRFTLFLDPGSWKIWGRRGTQAGSGLDLEGKFEIIAGQAIKPITIRMEERGTLRGRLLEAETGKPIAGGRLFLDEGFVLTTGADGRFEVGGLSRTNHETYVVASGRKRTCVLFDNTGRADTELEVPLALGVKVVGRVTDNDGKPIPGAYVGKHGSGSHFSLCGLMSTCDADGRFEYDGMPTEVETYLTAFAPEFIEEERTRIVLPTEGKPLEIHFQLGPKLAVAKEAAAGKGEKSRVVLGIVRGPDKKPLQGVVIRWGYEPVSGAIKTRTDVRGQFRMTVPDKPNYLSVLPHEFLPQFPAITDVGDQKLEIVLQEGPHVRGRTLDDAGKPIQGVTVLPSIRAPEANPRFATGVPLWESAVRTDSEGKFNLKGIPESASFTFLKEGLDAVRNRRLDFAKDDTVVTMQYGGALSGRVVGPDGQPIRNFRVLTSPPRERQKDDKGGPAFAGYMGIGVRFTSADGSFVVTGVASGARYRVKVLAEGYGEAVLDRMKTVPVNQLANTEPVTLRVGPPIPLRVQAMATTGTPVPGAMVTLVYSEPAFLKNRAFDWRYLGTSWEDKTRSRTGPDGWADFPGLAFGEGTVIVQVPGYARQRVEWREHQKELKFELPPEAVVSGDVRDAAGLPLKDFYVRLKSATDIITAQFGASDKGTFRLGELPAGTWSLEVLSGTSGDVTIYESVITLKAGDVKMIEARGR